MLVTSPTGLFGCHRNVVILRPAIIANGSFLDHQRTTSETLSHASYLTTDRCSIVTHPEESHFSEADMALAGLSVTTRGSWCPCTRPAKRSPRLGTAGACLLESCVYPNNFVKRALICGTFANDFLTATGQRLHRKGLLLRVSSINDVSLNVTSDVPTLHTKECDQTC